jgi:predicted HicB family RNase H-like nuclease
MSSGGDGNMVAKQRITIRIPKKLNIELSNRAKEIGVSKNSLVLHILWKKVDKENLRFKKS